jgi:hypothetical protein
MSMNDEMHFDVLQNIEAGLKLQYELNPDLTDSLCVLALENAVIAIKKEFGYAKNEAVLQHPLTAGIIDWCTEVGMRRINEVGNLSLKEYIAAISKVKRSVIRHSAYGVRGYYDFIKNYV